MLPTNRWGYATDPWWCRTIRHLAQALLACCSLLIPFVLPSPIDAASPADDALDRLFAEYHQDYLILFPLEATNFGDHRYDDQLPIDIGADHRQRVRQFYEQTLSRLQQIDLTEATPLNRLMAEVLRYELQMRLEELSLRSHRIPMHQFHSLPLTIAQMGSGSSSQPFRSVQDYENWLARAAAFDAWSRAAVEQFRLGMQEGYVLPRVLVERMIDQMLDPAIVTEQPEASLFWEPIDRLPEQIDAAERVRLTDAYRRAIAEHLIPAYRRLGKFLQEEYLPAARTTSGIGALPGGREEYLFWVRRWTTTDLTPDAIFEIGLQEVERITAEMRAVQEEMGFDGTLHDFFHYLRTDPRFRPFRTAEEVLDFFRRLPPKLEPGLQQAFLRRPRTPLEIRRTESFREKTASAEYMPGAADGSRPGIFYCPIPNPEEFNITSGMESLFLHEAIPGHHYQISLQQENTDLPEFARFLWYGAYGEGWALYCESIGEELGLYTDPQQRIGALGDEMHRAIRLVVDVGLHWKGWTREQAIAYMMEHEQIAEQSAVAEVERYMAMPGQALSYKVGQLAISAMRQQCAQRLGERFSLPHFHDEVLRHGCLPLRILRARLENWEPPSADRTH
ncbi:MAG: hypothetical protein KatS3mg111_3294 [Pirellulaceae bacterium]|nr:MAG: hypothetical protein KatS3mg111_3294 [Pirellulaceae bacterium]